MWLYQVLFLLFSFQGEDCVKFLTQEGAMSCVYDFSDAENITLRDIGKNLLRDPTRKCNTIGRVPYNSTFLAYDYHFTHGMIYTIDSYSGVRIKGFPLNSSLEEISSDTTLSNKYNTGGIPHQYVIHAFAVDWVHDTCYAIIDGELFFSPVLRSDQQIPLTIIVGKPQLVQLIGSGNEPVELTNWMTLDPYEGWLFTVVKRLKSSEQEYKILRSDLKGNGLKILFTGYAFPNGYMVELQVEVGKKKLFVSYTINLSMYNYEGIFEYMEYFPHTNRQGITEVVGGRVYFLEEDSTVHSKVLFKSDFTRFEFRTEMELVHDVNTKISSFRVLDARAQRRSRDGKYLCDRKDCSDICEVRPSGDICVCFYNKAMSIDGVSCYGCGKSKLTSMISQPTIVNGTDSVLGDFPWHASLYYSSTREYFCGGTLISPRVVLTAAHCVTLKANMGFPPPQDGTKITVVLSHTNRNLTTPDTSAIFRKVTDVRVNEKYTGFSTNYANDIALLVLDSDVPVSIDLMPACLDFNLNQLPPYDAQTGYIVGFGDVEECGLLNSCSKPSETLRHANTSNIMSFRQCVNGIQGRYRTIFHVLTSDKFCIGIGTGSPIQLGDSGGGFTMEHQGLHYVTGVVSVKLARNNGSTLAYSFGACTNVSEHMDWLKRNLPT